MERWESCPDAASGDPLLLIQWNLQGTSPKYGEYLLLLILFLILLLYSCVGLTDRLQVANADGLRNPQNNLLATAEELRDCIVSFLCSPPNAATDLGTKGCIFQFLPSHSMTRKTESLIKAYPWLRHQAYNWPNPNNINVGAWADIATWVMEINITRANAAVGPTIVDTLFNF
jgi:hypothetical protein